MHLNQIDCPNPDLHELAQSQYRELRWRLNFLDSLGSELAEEPEREEIIKWYTNQHLN